MPNGTVTFLFTDIEGSTRLWERDPAKMSAALARHDALLREAIDQGEGVVFSTAGDAFCAAFATANKALAAACAGLHALAREPWPPSVRIAARMALHTGVAEIREHDYFGQPLNRVARLLAAGHGGQLLLSAATYEQVRDHLPTGVTLRDMGERRLKDLVRPEHVYQAVLTSLCADFPPLKTLDARAHNLPIQSTSFIGREQEMKEVKALLESSRLVTLTGSGGAGKTRLALQIAADCIDDFADGVRLVELAALKDARLVMRAVAKTFDVREDSDERLLEALAKALKDKELLLLLDNCEHLIDASARLCETLLTGCGRVRILATSREVLRVSGERAFRVPSLAFPLAGVTPIQPLTQYAAVRLFIDRAVAAQSTFRVDNRNAPAVASICYHLDGIPLAIELAAARVRSMSVHDMNERLNQRFRLLTGGARTALPRQRTLRAAIDWSYDLLNDQERQLLARLSVFAGGLTLAAAERVCSGAEVDENSMVDLLASLVDKSLLQVDEREGATRYWLLETVRQYARDRLREKGDTSSCTERHVSYFVSFAEEAKSHFGDAEQRKWMDRLEAEHDNMRAALAWSSGERGDIDAALRLVGLLQYFWYVRGHQSEGRDWCWTVLAQEGGELKSRAGAYSGAGNLARGLGDYAAAQSLYEKALAIYRDLGNRQGLSDSLSNLGLVGFHRGEYAAALTVLEEAVAIQRECGDRHLMAFSLNVMGMIAEVQADYARSRRLLEESVAIRRETGNRLGVAVTLNNLGNVAACQGDYSNARTFFEEGLAIRHELGDKRGVAGALISLGNLDLESDASAMPRDVFEQSLAIFHELGDRYGIGESLASLGTVALRQGDKLAGRGLLEQSLAVHRETGDRLNIAKLLTNLGIVAVEEGDYGTAHALIADSVTSLSQLGDRQGLTRALRAIGQVACVLRGPLHSARIWGGAERLREEIKVPIPPSDRPAYERHITAARSAVPDDAAFERAWQEGRAMTLEQVLDYALQEPPARWAL